MPIYPLISNGVFPINDRSVSINTFGKNRSMSKAGTIKKKSYIIQKRVYIFLTFH